MKRMVRDNKGASLVLVLVAMFFVGIIASIVLTMTVGNSRSTMAIQESSQSFYTTESVLDDFKIYLNKLANIAASEATVKALENKGKDVDEDGTPLKNGDTAFNDDEMFKHYFVKLMNASLDDMLDNPDIVQAKSFSEGFLKEYVTYARSGNISISYDSIGLDSDGYPELKGVRVTFSGDEDSDSMQGFEDTITTDIVIKATRPGIKSPSEKGNLPANIYRYILISGKDIVPSNQVLSNVTLNGGVYSFGYLNTGTTASTEEASLSLNSQSVIVKNDINVKKGSLNFGLLPSSLTINGKAFSFAKDGESLNTNVYCDNLKIGDAAVNWNMSGNAASGLYLRRNLELNGNSSSFIGNTGALVGYSSLIDAEPDKIISIKDSTKQPVSSAIVINGLGAILNLENMSKVIIAGQAYTALSNIDGVKDSYKSIPDSDSTATSTTLSYFTQGESISYRPLQALYLIPGDCIPVIGHNPMTSEEYKKFTGEITLDKANPGMKNLVGSPAYVAQPVRYVKENTSEYDIRYYLFWNFNDLDSAVEYLNLITGSTKDAKGNKTENRYEGLFQKQLEMLKRNGGYINLPESGVSIFGNGTKYSAVLKEEEDGSFSIEKYNTPGKEGGLKSDGFDYDYTSVGEERNSVISSLGEAGGEAEPYWESSFLPYLFGQTGNDRKGAAGTIASSSGNTGDLIGPRSKNTYDKDHFLDLCTVQNISGVAEDIEAIEAEKHDIVSNVVVTYDDTDAFKYKLITGTNISLGSGDIDADTKYIVISAGEIEEVKVGEYTHKKVKSGTGTVSLSGVTKFNGIIIADGTISLPRDIEMTCMGVLEPTTITVRYFGVGANPDSATPLAIKEYSVPACEELLALLEVAEKNDSGEGITHKNTSLRNIFNLAFNNDPPKNTGSVSVESKEWNLN